MTHVVIQQVGDKRIRIKIGSSRKGVHYRPARDLWIVVARVSMHPQYIEVSGYLTEHEFFHEPTELAQEEADRFDSVDLKHTTVGLFKRRSVILAKGWCKLRSVREFYARYDHNVEVVDMRGAKTVSKETGDASS